MGQVSRSDDTPVASEDLSLFGGSSGKASTATSPTKRPQQQQRQFEVEKAGHGTLDQVVSKYVDSTGPSTVTAFADTGGVMESKECLLSTHVPYSDESSSSTSVSRPNADTAESSPANPAAAAPRAHAAGSSGLFSLSSEVDSTYGSSSATTEGCNRPSAASLVGVLQQPNPRASRNPDNLESILPSSLIPTREYHHPHGLRSDSWVWDMPVHPPPAPPNSHAPVGVAKQHYNCDSHHSSTWQNLRELPDALNQFFNVVDSGHDVMNDVKHHEQQLLQLHQVGSPTSQWQMNLQGVGEYNSDSFNPMAEWEAARCQASTPMAYGLSDSHSGLCNDLYMLDNVTHHANSSASLQYPVYDDGYLFPHLMEESMLYV
jgi:hypothetical protein